MKKRVCALLLTLVMVLGLFPAQAFAAEGSAPADPVTAYLSLSDDAAFLTDQAGEPVALRELTVPYFDLKNYGLENFYFQSESYQPGSLKPENADPAVYEGKVTVLHLMIYATEVLKCGVAPAEAGQGYLKTQNLMASTFMPSGNPGSLYMTNIWGMDSNLNYYVQHDFPLAAPGMGSTMDQKLLRDGDVVTVGHFSNFMFFQDERAPFNHMEINASADTLTLDAAETAAIQVIHDGGGVSGGNTSHSNIDYAVDVYAADAAKANSGDVTAWTKVGTTDATGALSMTAQEMAALVGSRDLLLAVPGQNGATVEGICVAPAAFRLTVTGEQPPEQPQYGGEFLTDILLNSYGVGEGTAAWETGSFDPKASLNTVIFDGSLGWEPVTTLTFTLKDVDGCNVTKTEGGVTGGPRVWDLDVSDLTEAGKNVAFHVTKGGKTEIYRIRVVPPTINCNLEYLQVTSGETYQSPLEMTPAYVQDPELVSDSVLPYYVFGTSEGTVWAAPAEPDYMLEAYPLSDYVNGTEEYLLPEVVDGAHTGYRVTTQDPTRISVVGVDNYDPSGNYMVTYLVSLIPHRADEGSYATAMHMEQSDCTLKQGQQIQLQAVVDETIGTGALETLEWISFDEAVATVDQNGLVTYVGEGATTIQACGELTDSSYGHVAATCAVNCEKGEAVGPQITVTVITNTQSVAEDVTNYGMTALPEPMQVTVAEGSTVSDAVKAWAQASKVTVVGADSYITTIGDFGSTGTTAFQTMMTNAGLDPVPDIFQYAGWMYTVDGVMPNVGIAGYSLTKDCTVNLRYGVYMASGTWEQVDFSFLDAYNGLKARIAEANQLAAPSAAVTKAKTAAQAVIDGIDAEAGGLWLNYFAEKQTALSTPINDMKKADQALADALAGKITPETITINDNKPELTVGTDYQIPYTVGPEGASPEVTIETLLGDGCFTVSAAGVITPTKASTLCMVQVKSKEAPTVSANLMFTIVEPVDPDQEAADAVIAQIKALPAAEKITLENKGDIKAALDAYNALTDTQKALVTNHDKLTAAVAALAPLMQPAELEAYWPNFRGSDSNMAITSARTPMFPEATELKWNKKLGTGWSAAPSPMIIVDDAMVVMVGSNIYKLSLEDGSVLAQGKMVASIGFGIVIPTYGSGMIFCPLSNGRVQAFDATTLESLWVYQDALKGQPNCPITYADGMIYTGFWNSEVGDANYVAIDVRDEDPFQTHEAKEAVWTKTAKGGYYWAGSVVVGDAVIFGTDDGTSGTEGKGAHLYALNRKTGAVISDLTGLTGDQRSSIAYSAEKGRVYFTTKGGYLYSAAVDAVTGALSDLKGSKLNSNQSTSTPVVYGNQVYLCCGAGVGGGDAANNFTVCDADTLEQLYVVGMKGYPQCSPLLSTAYMETEGKLYFYLTYNNRPGGITLIKVDPTKTTADGAELVELYDAKGFEQYCICSVICGPDGTLYYKNDSGNILAVTANADKQAAMLASGKIDAIGEVTLASEQAITEARAAYDALTDAQKALVDNLTALTDAEAKLTALKADQAAADDVVGKIDAIGEVTLASEQAITEARTAYEALTDAQKALVTNLETLTVAEVRLAALKGDQAAAKAVIEQIDAIGQVTLESEQTVKAARAAYDALTDAQKELVTNRKTLTDAEAKLTALKADKAAAEAVVKQIEAIGQVTKDSEKAITEARAAYDALTEAQKALVGNLKTLTDAEKALEELKKPGGGSGGGSVDRSMEVSFRLIGAKQAKQDVDFGKGVTTAAADAAYQTWIATDTYTLEKGDKVYDLFTQALDEAGLQYHIRDNNNYVDRIWAPAVYGGYELSEFTNGPRSGWMYTVNGKHPELGLNQQVLKDGDVVVWHYINDYSYEVGDWSGTDAEYPSLGDKNTWVDFDQIPDVNPGKKPGAGGGTEAPEEQVPQNGKPMGFTDVQKGAWCYEGVKYVYEKGMMNGTTDTVFNPDHTITRGQIAAILWRLAGEPAAKQAASFTDVKADAYYAKAIAWAAEQGVTTGYADGSFKPDQPINREQLAAFLYRYAKLQGKGFTGAWAFPLNYPDAQQVSEWAYEPLCWTTMKGVINGKADGTLAPKGNATRAQAAVMLMRYCETALK